MTVMLLALLAQLAPYLTVAFVAGAAARVVGRRQALAHDTRRDAERDERVAALERQVAALSGELARVHDGLRFTTALLERGGPPARAAAAPRVDTPH